MKDAAAVQIDRFKPFGCKHAGVIGACLFDAVLLMRAFLAAVDGLAAALRAALPARRQEQIWPSAFVMARRPVFPLPPCLAGGVGRSRYADRLRLNIFCSREFGCAARLQKACKSQPAKTAKAGTSPAIAQQQKYDL
ncbi:MAG: hypothetical protein WBW35_06370 [Xanthobacteraceae bacterium]